MDVGHVSKGVTVGGGHVGLDRSYLSLSVNIAPIRPRTGKLSKTRTEMTTWIMVGTSFIKRREWLMRTTLWARRLTPNHSAPPARVRGGASGLRPTAHTRKAENTHLAMLKATTILYIASRSS